MTAPVLAALDAFAAHLAGTPGVATVFATVPTAAIPAGACPALVLDVRAPATRIVSSRRTLIWPVDVYGFATPQTADREADIRLAVQLYSDLIARIDQGVKLGGLLRDPIEYPDPIGTDPGPLAWDGKNYVGFVLMPQLPVWVETRFAQ